MKENQNLDFKQIWKDEYLEYVSGFANSQGGSLLIGVDDKGNVAGVANAKKLMEDIPNKIVTTTGVVPDVSLLEENGKEYIKITIAPSNTPITYKGRLYFRSGTTLQQLDGMAAQNFLLNKMGKSWDEQIVEGTGVKDIDASAVTYFVKEGIANGRLAKSVEKESIEKILGNLKLMNDEGKMTMAALLLFGKNPQAYCLNARFKIGRFGNGAADLITQDLIEGNLIQMADKVIDVLSAKYLVRPIHYEGMQRVEPLEIPEKGLREILYNSIIHKSYDGPDNQMKVYDDRISLWNYGKMPEGTTISDMFKEHRSMPRNKLIANAFFHAGFVEAWGRGFEIIEESFKNAELEVPQFVEEFSGVTVNIKREVFAAIQHGARIDDRTGKVVNASYDTNDVTKNITDRQQLIYNILSIGDTGDDTNNDTKTTSSIAIKLGVSSRTIKRDLKVLQDLGYIEHCGPTRGGYWKVLIRNRQRTESSESSLSLPK